MVQANERTGFEEWLAASGRAFERRPPLLLYEVRHQVHVGSQ